MQNSNGNERGHPPRRTHMKCPMYGCKRVFTEIPKYNTHIKDHELPTQSLPGKKFSCSAVGCSASLPSMKSLMEHMREHHKPNIFFLCESCRAKLRSLRGLLTHLHTCSKVSRSKAGKLSEPMDTQPPLEAQASTAPVSTPSAERLAGERNDLIMAMFSDDDDSPPEQKVSQQQGTVPPSGQIQTSAGGGAGPAAALPQSVSSAPPLSGSAANHVRPYQAAVQPPQSQLRRLLPQTVACAPPTSLLQGQAHPRLYSHITAAVRQQPQAVPPQAPPPALAPAVAPAPPLAPQASGSQSSSVSSAVWKKNQDLLTRNNRRVLWVNTKGSYRCVQCDHVTPLRKEMTAHIKTHKSVPAGRKTKDTTDSQDAVGDVRLRKEREEKAQYQRILDIFEEESDPEDFLGFPESQKGERGEGSHPQNLGRGEPF